MHRETLGHKIYQGITLFLKVIVIKPLKQLQQFIFIDLKSAFINFNRHDGELSICALAFYLLISFIPISLVVISGLTFVFKSDEMVTIYIAQLKQQLPSFNYNELLSNIEKIVYSKRYLAFIWVPFLFWWGSFVFDIIERALEKAFHIEEGRRYWKAKIRHFIIILGMVALFVILTLLSNFIALIKNSGFLLFIQDTLSHLPLLKDLVLQISQIPYSLTFITTLIANTALIFIIYRFVPPKKVNKTSLFKGALFVALLYELVKSIFSYYISNINDYSSIFGSLNTIVILMIWIWYTCFLLVMGAEVAWVIFEKNEGTKKLDFGE